MPRKQSIGDLGYRLRRRLITSAKSRNRDVKWKAAHQVEQQATKLRQLAIYCDFLISGKSVERITADQKPWTVADVEEAIRTRGGTA